MPGLSRAEEDDLFAQPPSATRWLLRAGPAAVALVGLLTLHAPRSNGAQTVGDLAILACALTATVASVQAAARGGPVARGWIGVAVAAAVWSCAQAVWTVYGLSTGHAYPFPSVADLGFVGYAVPLAVGLALFPRATRKQLGGWRVVLDAVVVAAAVLFVSWATVLGPLVAAGGSGLARIVSLAYPVADVAVASLVLALGARARAGTRRVWLLLGSGLVLLALTDSTYVTLVARGEAGLTGTPLAAGWMSAFLLVAAAALRSHDPEEPRAARRFTLAQELLPTFPVVVALAVAARSEMGSEDPVLLTTGLVLAVAWTAQQVLAAAEKVRVANSMEDALVGRTREVALAQDRFRSLVDSSSEAIVSKSLDGTITSWNPAAERLFGWSATDMVGRPATALLPPGHHDEERELIARAARGERLSSVETDRLRSDGTTVPVNLTVSPILDDGTVTGVSVIAHDISLRRRQELELAAAHDHALEAARLKSEFLASMSHEIRTPMNGVIGLTGLLLETSLDETQRRYADGVRGAGEALLAIIDDILDFSKLESGRVELEDVPFDPRALVEEVGVLMAPAAARKGLELVAYGEPALPALLQGDPGRLRQVLLNLVGNAVKFTADGEVVLSARAVDGCGDRPVLEFRVTDTGQGIAEDDVERLFEPFSQADASTTRRFGGTGLGLAICRRLVEAMDGAIAVESSPGKGSTFRFSVPLGVAAQAAPALEPRTLRGRRVLVVDDNATNRLILQTQLDSWNIECDAADSAASAWTRLHAAVRARRAYDIVVLDLSMPDVDGLELARRMTADPVLATVPTLMLTSAGNLPRAVLEEANVRGCIAKPVRSSVLHDALVRLLDTGSGEQAPDPADVGVPAPRGGGVLGRVLVVEDNDINRLFAQDVLRALGYGVELVENGKQALEALARSSYAVVLMDCHMPVMDGFEATAELRRREGTGRRTPVIAMTAGVLAEDRQRCLDAGMDDFVAKPVDVAALRRTLESWADAARTAQPAPGPVTESASDPLLDLQRLAVLRSVGPEDGWGVLPSYVSTFTAGAAERRARLRRLWQEGDGEGLADALHELRGAAATLGADALAQRCAELETALRSGGACTADDLAGVEQALEAGCRALDQLVAERSASA